MYAPAFDRRQRKTKLGNAVQVASKGTGKITCHGNHEIVNHRRVEGFENIRPEYPTVSIDDVVGHGYCQNDRSCNRNVKLTRFWIDFRVRCHGACDAIGVVTVAF